MNRGAPDVPPPADPAFDLDLSGVRSDVLKRVAGIR